MDWTAIIGELGGGLSAVVIVALAYAYWRKDQALSASTERYIEMALSTQQTLQDLTAAIREKQL